jgi:hypothetical protein
VAVVVGDTRSGLKYVWEDESGDWVLECSRCGIMGVWPDRRSARWALFGHGCPKMPTPFKPLGGGG